MELPEFPELETLSKKYDFKIRKERRPYSLTVIYNKTFVIPEVGKLENEFIASIEIISWKKVYEEYGKRIKPYDYEVRVHASGKGYETFWMSRTLQGNDLHALVKEACSIIEKEYNRWVGFLEKKKKRLLGREEGLWKWFCLIPIASMFLFRRR